MPAPKQSSAKEKAIAVRVVKAVRPVLRPAKHLTPAPTDPARVRLLWRSVAIASVLVIVIGAMTVWANLDRPQTADSFWANLTNRVAQVGTDFNKFWKELTGAHTVRPEDKYKELEKRVFPPLPVSAQE